MKNQELMRKRVLWGEQGFFTEEGVVCEISPSGDYVKVGRHPAQLPRWIHVKQILEVL